MRWFTHAGLTMLHFPALMTLPGIRHACVLGRIRSEQTGWADLNLGLHGGTSDALVWRNRRRIRAWFGSQIMIFAHQVHGAQVAVWDQAAQASQTPDTDYLCLEGDALVTDRPGHLLFIQTADCQAVLLVDPQRRVVANVHAGWRGTIQNIVGRTVECMATRFGCRPSDLICGIAPSLGPCCAQLVNYRSEIPPQLWGYGDARNHFDFWRLTTDQLVAAGVQRCNVICSNICTRCNTHLFFSYRADHNCGRFATVVVLDSGQ